MMKKLFVALVLSAVVSVGFAADIHMAGDSTMASYKGRRGAMTGWGEVLPEQCRPGVTVNDAAIAGYSVAKFTATKKWDALLKQVKPGDYVIIQFGHNDQKAASDPKVGPEKSLEIYKTGLAGFIQNVKDKQGKPVVVTSIIRCTYGNEGKLVDTPNLRAYCDAAIEVAGKAEVPVIDLNRISGEKIGAMANKDAEKLYMVSVNRKDRTHLNKAGAQQYATWFVEAAKAAKLPIAECFQ